MGKIMEKGVSIIGIDGRDDQNRVDSLLRAILYSQKQTRFDATILSVIKPSIPSPNVDWVSISPINNKKEYSHFVLMELHKYQKSSHTLMVQRDGFVVNGESWKDSFLEYDYIGSPWPSDWPVSTFSNRVGNGGFSLRSSKLISVCPFLNYKDVDTSAEDVVISVSFRSCLETLGLKFAPLDVASLFSLEWLEEPNEYKNVTFGFHDKHNKITKRYYNLIE